MNLQNDPQSFAVMKFGIGQPVPRTEDPDAGARRGPLHRRHQSAGPGLCGDGAQPHRARHHQGHRHRRGRARMPGVLGVYDRRRSRRAGYGTLKCRSPFKNRDGTPMKQAAAPGAGRPTRCASSATRSPSWSPKPLLQAQGRRRGGRASTSSRCRPSPMRAKRRAPGAPLIYDDVPGNVALDYPLRRHRDKSPRPSPKAAHVTRLDDRQHPRRRQRRWSRARRSATTTRRATASRCTSGCQGVFGMSGNLAGMLKVEPEQVRIADRQCRRLVRHEGARLSRICLRAACRARARPPGEMDRRALRQLRVRQPRPRPRASTAELALDADGNFLALRLTGFGNLGALPVAGRRRCRRRSTSVKNVQSVYRTPLIEVLDQVRVHQHHADRRLSRRRPARRQLLHGAADRARPRARWASTASSCAAATRSSRAQIPYKTASGIDLRQRRFPGRARAGARRSPTGRASPSASGEPKRGKLRGLRHRQLPRSHRAADQGDGRHPLRGRRHRHASSPARSTTARAMPRRSPRC